MCYSVSGSEIREALKPTLEITRHTSGSRRSVVAIIDQHQTDIHHNKPLNLRLATPQHQHQPGGSELRQM
ncbi:hypothetical protein E2C01_050660 [Portunus trituberculatus]|uniref:Uncharacterized protein n=1 Tax=Portunus trituberculatus TaxID=210409 RepID=A0A5B7GGZ5_PORTR|nr:hypothetical protein [Portunus trituberculatus]